MDKRRPCVAGLQAHLAPDVTCHLKAVDGEDGFGHKFASLGRDHQTAMAWWLVGFAPGCSSAGCAWIGYAETHCTGLVQHMDAAAGGVCPGDLSHKDGRCGWARRVAVLQPSRRRFAGVEAIKNSRLPTNKESEETGGQAQK